MFDRTGGIPNLIFPREVLLDHLVGAGEQACRDSDVQHPRRLEIDDHPKLGRELDWQIAGAFTSDDPVNTACRLPEEFGDICAMEHQGSGLDERRPLRDDRNL